MRRLVLVLASSLVLATAQAWQPLTSPIYYLGTAPVLEVGEGIVGRLTTASGRNFKDGSHLDVVVLHGEAGDAVELRAASADFDTVLTLVDPSGNVVASNDDDPDGSGTDAAVRATLPVSGTYLVVVSGYGPSDLGRYHVTVARGPAGAAAPATPVTVPTRTDGTLPAGGTASFLVELAERTVLGVDVRSSDFDTIVELLADGVLVAENDDGPLGTDSALVTVLEAGVYEIRVSSYGGVRSGAFTLELVRYVPQR